MTMSTARCRGDERRAPHNGIVRILNQSRIGVSARCTTTIPMIWIARQYLPEAEDIDSPRSLHLFTLPAVPHIKAIKHDD